MKIQKERKTKGWAEGGRGGGGRWSDRGEKRTKERKRTEKTKKEKETEERKKERESGLQFSIAPLWKASLTELPRTPIAHGAHLSPLLGT